MTLELLPNEILIECFEYVNPFEIFYSFGQLNSRFSRLIRSTPLRLNFEYIRKSLFDQFCTILQSNCQLKNEIRSLKLSNKDTCGQIEHFLSLFSLNEFIQLRSLTLIQIEQNQFEKIKSILPFLHRLHSFRVLDTKYGENDLFNHLPMSNLRRLTIPTVPINGPISSLTYLSISSCSLDQILSSLFQYAPLLKSLKIDNISKTSHTILNLPYYPANHLKQLIIHHFEYSFEDFEILIKSIPYLKHLTICALDNNDMINPKQWESLIQSFLPNLKIFHFIFGSFCRGKTRDDIINKFQLFQTEFWFKQHQWFTEYVFDMNSAVIYTLPYALNTYRLTSTIGKYSNLLKDVTQKFDNVTNLTVCHQAKSMDYYPSITTLGLTINFNQSEKQVLGLEYIQSLQRIINFSYLNSLDISSYCIIESSALIEICKQTPRLTSIAINRSILWTLFGNPELCGCLNQIIKKMNVDKWDQNSFGHSNEIEEFCKIFSNLEQLTCQINHLNQLLIFLNQTSKLSLITVFLSSVDNVEEWFENVSIEFNLTYRINYFSTNTDGPREFYRTEVSIWTGGKK
jgi:hypothetical protein